LDEELAAELDEETSSVLEDAPSDELDEELMVLEEEPADELDEELLNVLEEEPADELDDTSLIVGFVDLCKFFSWFRPRNSSSMSKDVNVVYRQVVRCPTVRLVMSSLITQKACPVGVSFST
jgi:hypothetical protein